MSLRSLLLALSLVRTLVLPDTQVRVAFSPDAQTLTTSSADGTLKFWHVPDGALLRTLRHPGGVSSFGLSPDG